MARTHSIVANGARFSAGTGDVILDAAIDQGVAFPHDCRAGRCGTCVARVVRGVTLGGQSDKPGMILACQARALADLELEFERLPPTQSIGGRVAYLIERGPDVVEVGIDLARSLDPLAGQYCKFKFRGFPQRSFSPTFPADGGAVRSDITLHVKRVRGGCVSNALGKTIGVGHRLRVDGPFGTAFYRQGTTKRLVLVAGGTGFAPILAVAKAALAEDRARPMTMVVGARTTPQLYMVEGLIKLLAHSRIEMIVTAGEVAPEHREIVRRGDLVDHVPRLRASDLVYACGSPNMVARLAKLAVEAGADFHADPFEANGGNEQDRWFGRSARRLGAAALGEMMRAPSDALRWATRRRA